jgi:hypothetical protein
MSLLTVVLVLAMLLWALGFVVSGFVLAEEVLWRHPVEKGAPPISRTRRVGGMLLLVIGGILVMSAIVTGFFVADREVQLIRLEATVRQLEVKVRSLESTLSHELSVLR